MEKQIKKQILTVSKRFLSGHPRAGEPTKFRDKILMEAGMIEVACDCGWAGVKIELSPREIDNGYDSVGMPVYIDDSRCPECDGYAKDDLCKIHTIRGNYPYWASPFERGMLLSVRQWSGKPYHTSQETFLDLEPGKWGVQRITMINGENGLEAFVCEKNIDIDALSANDGLSRADFEAWFAPYFKRENVFYGVIIHFTDFRYQ